SGLFAFIHYKYSAPPINRRNAKNTSLCWQDTDQRYTAGMIRPNIMGLMPQHSTTRTCTGTHPIFKKFNEK
ncbi:hypothetical protein ACTVOO_22070, partial [Serratia bockelmannii]|uniref:hypothetical protein n=1 Tax=Serratia bockelmannii TaxID=2703793 RepID=UPI003FA6AA25